MKILFYIFPFFAGNKSQSGSSSCLNSSTSSSQAFGVKSSIRVGNAASNAVESSGGALAHEGAGTSGTTTATATANPSVPAAVANPTPLSNSTHKHLLRSRVKLVSEQTKDWPSTKVSGKHHKKDSSSGSCSSSRYTGKTKYFSGKSSL